MPITDVETVTLRIPFKAGSKSDASAWGDSNLPVAESLLIKALRVMKTPIALTAAAVHGRQCRFAYAAAT
jgi:hypothetical protein